ncbi:MULTISPECIES: SRPBCC domain-containing protein [Alphaproteobacteria]|jgi:uncharacterized protein YndB with AHSA1/START domain|uniref:Activator of Hsp90 ATPase homologue 1/2-like C-terminal domain-containing protein n=2 Tax=Alphaproteobacteria TaxID=28211 RepID=A0A246K0F0_9SPHN|nr:MULTISPECIES: SRPBCC domain-containing protein [Alphaproteobacteria]OWQ98960.1 hypothetical protein CDQ92_01900 [Sphingopyxis bauzanensis]GGJ64762.1 hypothetical protein GCM10011393_38790 [Sphingopyxis bauzanensis]SDH19289.1 Uncharacterized conserved protein YndB, AHSA1/START domain [Pelagibacterium luteolum]
MKITTEALIDSPIETVWRAFNDPADIVQWDASDDWRTTWASNDLQVGGLLKLRIEPRHDGTSFDFAATYTRLEPMRVIEWRTDDDRHVRVEFAETEAGVVVHQTFDAEPTPSVDEQRQDWQGVLDNFARHVTAIAG